MRMAHEYALLRRFAAKWLSLWPMAQRWRKVTLAPEDLQLVVLWSEMLAATGIPESRAWQLVQEGTFPIRQLPYHGYSARGTKRYMGRSQIDPRGFTFSKVEVLKFIA